MRFLQKQVAKEDGHVFMLHGRSDVDLQLGEYRKKRVRRLKKRRHSGKSF